MRHALLCLAILGCTPASEDEAATNDESLTVYPSPNVPWHFAVMPSSTSGLLPPPDDGPIGAGTNDDYRPNRGHEVYRPALGPCIVGACPAHKLVLVIPGHGATPHGLTTFLKVAADQGYHVIGVDYPNPINITDICDGQPVSCYENVRNEVVFANDTSTAVPLETHPQDAIMKRVKALLLYMQNIDPYGGWGQFLDSDPSFEDGVRPHYASMVVAAHSLGTGYAGYLVKKFAVDRVVLLAGFLDGLDTNPPTSAPWVASHATPSSAYRGLIHQNDNGNDRFARSTHNWQTLQIPASQQHISTVPCTGSCSPHNSVVQDEATYGDRWRSMLGTP